MNNQEKDLITFFKTNQGIYLQVEMTAKQLINSAIAERGFFVMDVASRTKAVESLVEKVKRKSGKYKSISDITDLVGLRIICYFSDTVDAIAQMLSEIFVIDEAKSIDKRAIMQATQFGYLSLHIICYLKPGDDIPEDLSKIPFEIQIRTVLQHAWAQVEHDLGYKSDFGVPRPIRRDFSRVASLLELADQEFLHIRDGAIAYNEKIKCEISADVSGDIPLDRVSLKYYMEINKDMLQFYDRIKSELSADIEVYDHSNYVEPLMWLGIDTIDDLAALFKRSKEFVFQKISGMTALYELDIFSASSILKLMCEYCLINEDYSESEIAKFYKLNTKDPDIIDKNVAHILLLKNTI